jgi:hypothetical protein
LSQVAFLAHGAGIPVIAGSGIEGVDAALQGGTGIVGAEIVVVAGRGLGSLAFPTTTFISESAEIAIVTLSFICSMNATVVRVTGVVSAEIQVVTNKGPGSHTLAGLTGINRSADIVVAAGGTVEGVDASLKWVAGIVGAGVLIVTLEGSGPNALPSRATVFEGAEIAVIALDVVGNVLTTLLGLARIVGAKITVVAEYENLPLAFALNAGVLCGT